MFGRDYRYLSKIHQFPAECPPKPEFLKHYLVGIELFTNIWELDSRAEMLVLMCQPSRVASVRPASMSRRVAGYSFERRQAINIG